MKDIPFTPAVFYVSPLIWITLWGFYLSLMIPLPVLASVKGAGISPGWLVTAIALGGMALQAALSQRVSLDDDGIHVGYARWVPSFWQPSWFLAWENLQAIKPRSTGQGGLVYYLQSTSGIAYLLPMRIAGFARMVRLIQAKTGLDMTCVKPLAQPWMYAILLGFTGLMTLTDIWILWVAIY